MINQQRSTLSNWFLNRVISCTTVLILLCLSYTTKLLRNLKDDSINPIQICEKINRVKGPGYVAHLILFFGLIFRGWWQVGLLNFPFIFYSYAQYINGEYRLDHTTVFSKLSKELGISKAQAFFFVLIIVGTFIEWVFWAPPKYIPMDEGWHIIKNIQRAH